MRLTKSKNNVIAYTVSKCNNEDLFISIQNGEIVVRAPWHYTSNQIQEVIENKKRWIKEKIYENTEIIEENQNIDNLEKERQIIKTKRQARAEKAQPEYIRNEIVKILGEDCKVIVNYKNLKKPTLTVEGKNIKISLPNRFKKLDREEILIKLIEKLYDKLAEKEIERSMEKARKLLNFAPEDYKIERMKNIVGKCDYENQVITINPEIVIYNREIIDYIVVHEFCHLKCKTHSKKMKDMLNKYVPNYEKLEEQIKSKY